MNKEDNLLGDDYPESESQSHMNREFETEEDGAVGISVQPQSNSSVSNATHNESTFVVVESYRSPAFSRHNHRTLQAMTFSDAEEDQPTNRSESSASAETSEHGSENGASVSALEVSQTDSNSSSSSFELVSSADSQAPTEHHLDNNDAQAQSAASSSTTNPTQMEDVNKELVSLKLDQIKKYIVQTTVAMQALEQANKTDSDQYQTLFKVLNDLKSSQEKLDVQWNYFEDKSPQAGNTAQQETGTERVGIVGIIDEAEVPISMRERLERHELEQGALSTRLRDSVAKRQELVARYESTRQRLNELKRQRQGLVQEERRLLHDQGAPEDPYDPIPEAENWSVREIQKGITEFQGLKDKVVHLQSLYRAQAQVSDPSDLELQDRIIRKREQVDAKEAQVDQVLSQLNALLDRRQVPQEQVSGLLDDSIRTSPSPPQESLPTVEATEPSVAEAIVPEHEVTIDSTVDVASTDDSSPDVYITTSGVRVELSEMEKSNPEIKLQYESLMKAKRQLLEMQELESKLADACKTPGAVTEILEAENLGNLLEEPPTRTYESSMDETPDTADFLTPSAEFSAVAHEVQASGNELLADAWSTGSSLTAMQKDLNKKVTSINAINEGHVEHTSPKTENTNVWSGFRNKAQPLDNVGSHLQEVRTLQEELRQKKNAMESLRNSMGKSSAFLPDMTDNISENISDHSDQERYSRFCIERTNDDLQGAESNGNNYSIQCKSLPRPILARSQMSHKKNPLSGRVSVNNLEPYESPSVRPKQNRSTRNVHSSDCGTVRNPTRSENVYSSESLRMKSKLSDSVNQMANLRQTMNNLKQAEPACNWGGASQPNGLMPPSYFNQNMPYLPNPYYCAPRSCVAPHQCHPNAGFPVNYDANMFHQINTALQQCMDQLEVHSFEIESLTKQLEGCETHFIDPEHKRNQQTESTFEHRNSRDDADPIVPVAMDSLPHLSATEQFYPKWANEPSPNADLMFENQNFFAPFEGLEPENSADFDIDVSYPINNVPSGPFPWLERSSTAPSRVLNNQVLPGSRANNYWDNFRSYSQQNPLSTNKNAQEVMGSPLMANGCLSSERLKSQVRDPLQRNRHFNSTTPKNPLNKASDKNNRSSSCKQFTFAKHKRQLNNNTSDAGAFREYVSSVRSIHNDTENRSPPEDENLKDVWLQVNKVIHKHKHSPQFLLDVFQKIFDITGSSDQNDVLALLRGHSYAKTNHQISTEHSYTSKSTQRPSNFTYSVSPVITTNSKSNDTFCSLSPPSCTGTRPKTMLFDKQSGCPDGVSGTGTFGSSHGASQQLQEILVYTTIELVEICRLASHFPVSTIRILDPMLARVIRKINSSSHPLTNDQRFAQAIVKPIKKLFYKYHSKSHEQIKSEVPSAICDLFEKCYIASSNQASLEAHFNDSDAKLLESTFSVPSFYSSSSDLDPFLMPEHNSSAIARSKDNARKLEDCSKILESYPADELAEADQSCPMDICHSPSLGCVDTRTSTYAHKNPMELLDDDLQKWLHGVGTELHD